MFTDARTRPEAGRSADPAQWQAALRRLALWHGHTEDWYLASIPALSMRWSQHQQVAAQLEQYYLHLHQQLIYGLSRDLQRHLDLAVGYGGVHRAYARSLCEQASAPGEAPLPAWAIQEQDKAGHVLLLIGSLPRRLRSDPQGHMHPEWKIHTDEGAWNVSRGASPEEQALSSANRLQAISQDEIHAQVMQAITLLDFAHIPDRQARHALMAEALSERLGRPSRVRSVRGEQEGPWVQAPGGRHRS